MLKGMLRSPRLKDQLKTIGIDPYLSNNSIYEHKCLENIKTLYKQAGKCDDQQQFENILEDAMVSTTEGFTSDSPISPTTSTPAKKPRARISLRMFTNIFDVKKGGLPIKWELLSLSARKLNLAMSIETKAKGNSKIDEHIKKYLYNWIMNHPQVVQSTIVNDLLKVKIDGHAEPQLLPKCLFQVYVRELHNNLVSDTIYGGLKEARNEDDNIIISDYTLRSLLPP